MPKIYSDVDVLTSAKKRLTIAFQEFDMSNDNELYLRVIK